MKVLVACEESQRVCIAFRERGHEAYSCDIQQCSGGHPEWHIQGDVIPLLNGRCEFATFDGKKHTISDRWDLIIAHPPCTYLSKAGGNRLRINGKIQQERFLKGLDAKEFFMNFYKADCNMVCVENPIPLKIFRLPQYTQIIQPYMFGDPWMKTTCLWLRGLPELTPDNVVKPIGKWVNCSDHRKYKNKDFWSRSGVKSAKERSKTFPGIARAMAEQWESHCSNSGGNMYPYHNTIKKRIRNGELIGFEYVDNYKNIGECLLLIFSSPPFERPIRPHKYHEYVDILVEWKRDMEAEQ